MKYYMKLVLELLNQSANIGIVKGELIQRTGQAPVKGTDGH